MTKSSIYRVFRSVALEAKNFQSQKNKQLEFPIRGAALCLPVVGEDKVVLVKREVPPNTGWSLPGGRVEETETFEEAALRELKEETGIEAQEIDFLLVDEHTNFHGPNGESISIDVKTYLIRLPEGTLAEQMEEDLPAQVFPLDRLPDGLLNLDRAKIESFVERNSE
jgi:ADP-ribose pyrophosphatase YjhB (NUDIX family)